MGYRRSDVFPYRLVLQDVTDGCWKDMNRFGLPELAHDEATRWTDAYPLLAGTPYRIMHDRTIVFEGVMTTTKEQ